MMGNLGYALLPRSELFGELIEDELRGALGLSWTPSAEERWLLLGLQPDLRQWAIGLG